MWLKLHNIQPHRNQLEACFFLVKLTLSRLRTCRRVAELSRIWSVWWKMRPSHSDATIFVLLLGTCLNVICKSSYVDKWKLCSPSYTRLLSLGWFCHIRFGLVFFASGFPSTFATCQSICSNPAKAQSNADCDALRCVNAHSNIKTTCPQTSIVIHGSITFWILAFSSSSCRICLLTSSRFSRRSSIPVIGKLPVIITLLCST